MTVQRPMFPPARNRAENAAGDNVVPLKRRRSKVDDRERDALDRFNADRQLAATLVWPEISATRDWNEQTDENLDALDFEGMPEFRGDGIGSGTPEFREQLDAYYRVVMVATRHALATLGLSRRKIASVAADCPEGAEFIAHLLKDGEEYAMQLLRLMRAATVRQVCGIALSEEEADEGNEPAPQAVEA